MPCGLLKLNNCGLGGSKLFGNGCRRSGRRGRDRRSGEEEEDRGSPSLSRLFPFSSVSPPSPPATTRLPSPSRRASSTASASRGRIFGPATRRSTTTSMLCRICRSSRRSSVSRTTRPSTRARTNPCFSKSSKRSRYSPFWPRISGASSREPRAGRQQPDPIDDLLPRLRRDGPMALRAVALAHAGEEHAEIIVDLRDRAHGRAGIRAAGLLRNGNRRAEAGDQIDVRLGHLPEELPGETGEALDVAPLPFGIQRIEGQGALARSADPVKQINRFRGKTRLTSRRLCSRAP